MGQYKEMKTTIKINGQDIPVDDAFNDLTPEQQEIEKAYIAEQLANGIKFGGGEPVAEKEPTTIVVCLLLSPQKPAP